jgi:gliding motility-associated-like protein
MSNIKQLKVTSFLFVIAVLISLISFHKAEAQFPCINANWVSYTMTPPPGGGNQYPPNFPVTICVTITQYNQSGANWIHGVFLTGFGAGWNTATYGPSSSPGGVWNWFNSFTASSSGQFFNTPGYFVDSNFDGNPGNNFGVSAFGGGTFCFTISTGPGPSGASLDFGIVVTADGYTGSWNSSACDGMVPVTTSTGNTIIAGPTLVLNPTNPTCNAACNGSITTNVNGGTLPYTYSWANGLGNGTSLSGLCAGTYTLTLTDGANNSTTQSVTLVDPPVLTITANPLSAAICDGQSTTLGVSGALNYTWAPAAGLSATTGNSVTASPNATTTYTITGTDANNCQATTTVTVTVNPAPTASFVTDLNVCDNTNSNLDASGSAVQAPSVITNYAWDFNNDGVVDLNSPGPIANYTYSGIGTVFNTQLTVTSTGGCTNTVSQNITVLPNPVADFTWPALLCGLTFNLDASASNVAAPQNITNYNWDFNGDGIFEFANGGVNPSNTFPGTGNNTVGLQVVTNEGCIGTVTNVINIPSALSVVIAGFTDVTCFGANDGTATAVGNGGTGVLHYSWNSNPIQNTDIATGLGAGNYTVTVTDAANCSVTASVTINEPAQLTLNLINSSNVTCNGLSDGTATVSSNGGTGLVGFSWNSNPVQNTAAAVGLPAGAYTVTATDVNQCQATLNVNITEPTPLTVVTNSTDISCFGGTNGSLNAVVNGGTVPYVLQQWNTVPLTNGTTANNVVGGTYTFTVTDANGCVETGSATVIEPAQIVLSTSVIDVNCPNASTGSATVNVVSGGVGVINYAWNTVPPQNTGTAQNLPAGNYSVVVTDGNGCTANASVTLTTLSLPFQATGAITDVVCGGAQNGAINLNITQGSGPYQFNWVPSGAQTQNVANLSGGNYGVLVTDINGCQWPLNFVVNEPPALTVNPTVVDLKCFGESTGQIKLNAAGGTLPYTYSWNGIPGGATYSNLPAGNYNAVVTDANGCTANATLTLTDPPQITIDYTPEYEINIAQEVTLYTNPQGGTGALTLNWSPETDLSCNFCATPDASPVRNTRYTITVTDENQCSLSQDLMVYVNKIGPFIPNAFTPNGDSQNESFRVIAFGISDFMMRIYDRWGNLVYITDDLYSGWDGNIGSTKAEPGSYAYKVDMKYIDGKVTALNGSVMLVR